MSRKADDLKSHLRPGDVYRRQDLKKWSKNIDRELAQLVEARVLVKVHHGIYECPQNSRYGLLPPSPEKVVRTFLRGDDFLLTSPNDYNNLGFAGTTQLYNYQIEYNHRRHGRFQLGGQFYEFRKRGSFPKKVTLEFILVELINNLNHLAEDPTVIYSNVPAKLPELSSKRLRSAVKRFARVSTHKFWVSFLQSPPAKRERAPQLPESR
jgi:hypothetical protein